MVPTPNMAGLHKYHCEMPIFVHPDCGIDTTARVVVMH